MEKTRKPWKFVFLHAMFWIKAMIAFVVSIVYNLHKSALLLPRNISPFSSSESCIHIPPKALTRNPQGFNNSVILSRGHRLEPEPGTFLWGFSLDWAVETPVMVRDKLGGKRPAVINSFVYVNDTAFEKDMILWMAEQTSYIGAMLQLTVMPTVPVEHVPDLVLRDMALLFKRINDEMKVPILVRYCHEMNGYWMSNFGLRPQQMIPSFRTLANYVHEFTNMSSMVWSVNAGLNYPYGGFDSSRVDSENLRLIDTNGNGVIDRGDDPYGPFYPGDEYVDWVGMSLYNYNLDPQTLQANPVTPSYITNNILGSSPLTNFYARFSTSKRKPMALSESGAAYRITNTRERGYNLTAEIRLKQNYWNAVLDVASTGGYPRGKGNALFPNLKMAVWFEEVKFEDGAMKDFAITRRREIYIAHTFTIQEHKTNKIKKEP
ncbi:hypothetical protein HDV05_005227 [Chytridiales sp. JEL 0842]|nr:hypothetical protein HDV05_005227 [Chytridiales sp. JEL 0842]